MPVLLITRDDIKRLCALDTGDTSPDADLDALLASGQPALEYGLDPGILAASAADSGLRAALTLGAAETLAGEWLRRQARAPGMSDDFRVGPLLVSASRTDGPARLGDRLAAQGQARLAPFARAARRQAEDASGGTPDGSALAPLLAETTTADNSLFGPSLLDLPFDALACDALGGAEEAGL